MNQNLVFKLNTLRTLHTLHTLYMQDTFKKWNVQLNLNLKIELNGLHTFTDVEFKSEIYNWFEYNTYIGFIPYITYNNINAYITYINYSTHITCITYNIFVTYITKMESEVELEFEI